MNKERRKSLNEIREQLESLRDELEALKDEEQEYFDNMPEAFQGSEKGEMGKAKIWAMESAFESIDEAISVIEEPWNERRRRKAINGLAVKMCKLFLLTSKIKEQIEEKYEKLNDHNSPALAHFICQIAKTDSVPMIERVRDIERLLDYFAYKEVHNRLEGIFSVYDKQ